MSSPTTTVHTSDLPRDTSSTSRSPIPLSVHNSLSSALSASPTSIQTIERTLSEALSASGWTTNLRTYIQNLLRSGECSTYNEVILRVIKEVKVEGSGADKRNGVNGTTGDDGKVDLTVKEAVVKEGVAVVKKELEKVCTVVVDD
jgi:hypothetical protein